MSRLKSENCGRKVFRNTALFLLATRVLPAYPNFGQAKHGTKQPRSHLFVNRAIFCPYMWASFHLLDPSRYLSSFSSWRPKNLKNSSFSWICFAASDFFCRPAADSILMPPTFPIARLNRYTPNFSGIPQTWPGVNSLASRSSQSEVMPIFYHRKMLFLGFRFQVLGFLD